jgi:predicted aspartyl protease
MRKLFSCIFFLACLPAFPVPALSADAPQSCRLTRYATLPLKTESDGRVSVPVAIDGHDLSLLVDTGGAVATLSWEKVEEFGMRKKESSRYMIGAGGSVMSQYVSTENFSIGPLKGSGLVAYVDTRGLAAFDGTLGPDILRHFDVELDFANGVMQLFAPHHCPEKVVHWSDKGHVIVPVRMGHGYHIRMPVMLDGKEVMATIDSGAAATFMSMRLAKSIGIAEKSPDLKLRPGSLPTDTYKMYSYPFRALEFEGVSVRNPNIIIASNEFTTGLTGDLILGVGILRQLHLYIAYEEKKLYVTPALAN